MEILCKCTVSAEFRDGSRAAAISKMERFVIIVNGFESLTIITKCSILDVAEALDSPLEFRANHSKLSGNCAITLEISVFYAVESISMGCGIYFGDTK